MSASPNVAAIDWVRLRPHLVKEGYGEAEWLWPGTLPSLLVRVVAEDGTQGFGEATSQIWYLGETVEQIEAVLALYAARLQGKPADNPTAAEGG